MRTIAYSVLIYFCYEEYEKKYNCEKFIGLHSVAWQNYIPYKKTNNILQLQTTITFEMKHISFELYTKLFNASHVSLGLEKRNSIETLIYPAFSG